MNVLMDIVADTRTRVARRADAVPLSALLEAGEQRLAGPDAIRDFRGALAAPGISLIAEHKRSSPSAGVIRADLELPDVVSAYERAGAAALSVLTEQSRFGGALSDVALARASASLPILRKDFIVEEYQVHESLAAGADAILLIVAALDTGTLIRLHSLATQLGLATLLEVHDGLELDATHEIGADIVGINNRDLATLAVDVERTYELLPSVPDGALVVAESGFREHAELERLAAAGVDAVLIGEALMRSPDIEVATRDLLGSSG
ncbi:MAG TPA: indole-3-glycerol phosphate synthase TrpC [Solirubrobacteraceae bacterium]|jgi:indole-3-glycerol phosphate synthase|nr:indole-3-glycerol phosphate synthase TrpC [Solirubrobacteraceae bacterium]